MKLCIGNQTYVTMLMSVCIFKKYPVFAIKRQPSAHLFPQNFINLQ